MIAIIQSYCLIYPPVSLSIKPIFVHVTHCDSVSMRTFIEILNLNNSIESYDSKLRCRSFWDTLCARYNNGNILVLLGTTFPEVTKNQTTFLAKKNDTIYLGMFIPTTYQAGIPTV